MKTKVILILLASASLTANAQFQFQTAYQVSDAWRSGTLEVGYGINNHIISLGYQLNRDCRPTNDESDVFKHRFYGRTLVEQSSLSLGYEYKFRLHNSSWRPVVFATAIVSHAPVRNYWMAMDSTGTFNEIVAEIPPMTVIETYIGCGFDLDLFSNFYLFQKWGVGYSQFIGVSNGNMNEFGTKFQFGVGYTFN